MRVSHAARRCRWTRVNPTLLVGAHRKRPKSKLERGCDDESFSVPGCPRCHGGGDGVGSRARVFMTTRGLARVVCLRGFNVARRCRWAVRAHRQRPKSNSEDGCDDGGSSAGLQRRIFPYLTTQMPRARGVSASPKRPFAFLIHIRKPNRHPRHHLFIARTSTVPQNYLHAKPSARPSDVNPRHWNFLDYTHTHRQAYL